MRSLIILAVMLPAFANAQPGIAPAPSTTEEVLGLTRGAHFAGARGDCVGARILASRIQRLDPEFYAKVVVTDASITACKPKPRPVPPPEPPPSIETRSGHPDIDGGLVIGGTVLGGIVGAAGGTAAIGLGLAICAGDCEDPTALLALGAAGVVFGSSLIVHHIGRRDDIDSSFAVTFAGSALGMVAAIAIADELDPGVAVANVIVLPTIGAVLGFTLGSHYKPIQPVARPAIPAPRLSNDSTVLPLVAGSF